MKIAIITPVYNGEKTLAGTIISAKEASKKIEAPCIHYIYDDGSTDSTINLILTSNSDIVIPVRSEIRKGQSHARNVLLEKAIEEGCTHVAFLDADDQWHSEHLMISLEELKDTDVVYGVPYFESLTGERLSPNYPIPEDFSGERLDIGNYIWISSVIAKIECFKDLRFDSSLDGLEDYDMWYSIYKRGHSFKCTKRITMKYLVSPDSEASRSYLKLPALRKKHGIML
jgi:glycosyltransferase involved in cell wall biosynthesis